ncbi:acetylornithine deacetylase [Heyndrickxia acidicola]|uniref:Acetylornithine deacetylase n=1 Tax=Heyndrickxia acidicola TaxID=209389 RepID=A0ABU6MI55_9BACI|nr:acetylornithine deacetylase [Heyndrickxia acidicola]MED1204349.1 acetylornithine deacetylase [Heyndrickxia acidicola]
MDFVTEELAARITNEIEARKDELIQLVSKLVGYPTVSPPARNSSKIQHYINKYLMDLDFKTERWEVYPGDSNVVGILPGDSAEAYKSLIINGHVDVAEVGDESDWETPPFVLREEGGYLYGRGVADMKGGLAGALLAVKVLKDLNIPLKGNLQLQSVIGEEVGEAGTLDCTERGYKADFAVVVDTSDLHIEGQGGVITGWITIQSTETYHDGLRRKMVHAGGGIHGANAIEKMMKVISGLQELERHWAITKQYPGFAPGTNTINPAVIEGGRHAAFVADRCSLWVTVHFYPNENYEQIIKEIEEHIHLVAQSDPWLRNHPPQFKWGGKSMIMDKGEVFPSLEIDPEHIGTRLLVKSYRNTLGKKPEIGMSTTVTDAGWLGRAGIPTVIFGPGKLEDAHAINEKLEVQQLVDFTKTLAMFMAEWCNTQKEEKEWPFQNGSMKN